MKCIPIIVSIVFVAGCEGSTAFTAQNGVRVNPVNADVFEVFARPSGRKSDFWCGAGSYAFRVLGASDGAPVYAVGGAGRGVSLDSPDAAQFSLKPPGQASGATGRPASRGWGPEVGQSVSVGRARNSCQPLLSNDD